MRYTYLCIFCAIAMQLCHLATAQTIETQADAVLIDQHIYLQWDGQLHQATIRNAAGNELLLLQQATNGKGYELLFANGERAYWLPQSSRDTRRSFALDMYHAQVINANGTLNTAQLRTFAAQHPPLQNDFAFAAADAHAAQPHDGIVQRNTHTPIALQASREVWQDGQRIATYTIETQKIAETQLHLYTFQLPNGTTTAIARHFDNTQVIGIITTADSRRSTIEASTADSTLLHITEYLVKNGYL